MSEGFLPRSRLIHSQLRILADLAGSIAQVQRSLGHRAIGTEEMRVDLLRKGVARELHYDAIGVGESWPQFNGRDDLQNVIAVPSKASGGLIRA